MRLRKARKLDVPAMLALINGYADRNLLLHRTEESLRGRLGDFTVAELEGELAGCAALTELGPGLGEVRSLAVRADLSGRGIGRLLVDALLAEAAARGFREVLALTRRTSFFQALGFEATRRERFLDKLMVDCQACPMNLCCDETAMVRTPPAVVEQGGAGSRPPNTPLALAEVNSARARPVAAAAGLPTEEDPRR